MAGFGEGNIFDEVGGGGTTDGVSACGGYGSGDSVAIHWDKFCDGAGGFSEDESEAETGADTGDEFGGGFGAEFATADVHDAGDHGGLEGEEDGEIGEGDGLGTDGGGDCGSGFDDDLGDLFLESAVAGEAGDFELGFAGEFDGDEFGEAGLVCGGGDGESADDAIADEGLGVERLVEILASHFRIGVFSGERDSENFSTESGEGIGGGDDLSGVLEIVVDIFVNGG